MYPRDEGGMGVRDFNTIQSAAMVGKTGRIWESEGIWANWIRNHYVKEKALVDIGERYNDSPMWREVIKSKDGIQKCMECRANNEFRWKGAGNRANQGNIYETIRNKRSKDRWEKGIWTTLIRKTATFTHKKKKRRHELSKEDKLSRNRKASRLPDLHMSTRNNTQGVVNPNASLGNLQKSLASILSASTSNKDDDEI